MLHLRNVTGIVLIAIISGVLTSARPGPEFSLEKFLAKPFDLQAFKKKKHGANSTVVKQKTYYSKPAVKGIYYDFFLFEKGGGYIGKVPGTDLRLEDGLVITTFKPPGKNQHMYLDAAETLIELTSRYNDPDLPELAFHGIDTTQVKTKLGEPGIRKPGWIIYASGTNALLLHETRGRINFLRFIRLNFKLTADTIPAELLISN
jgi:hypothetical protein